jgi:hypothetical protein
VEKYSNSFKQADNLPSGKITGKTTLTLQVHNELCLHLTGVPVIPSDEYTILIGSDLQNGDGKYLKNIKVSAGKKVDFRLLQRGGITLHVPVVNPATHLT